MCEPVEKRACSFERIYFSRVATAMLPRAHRLWPQRGSAILDAMDHDRRNTGVQLHPEHGGGRVLRHGEGLEDELNKTKERSIVDLRPDACARQVARDPGHAAAPGEGGHQGCQAAHRSSRRTTRDELVAHVRHHHGSVRPGWTTRRSTTASCAAPRHGRAS